MIFQSKDTNINKLRINVLYTLQVLFISCMLLTIQILQIHGFGRLSLFFLGFGAILSIYTNIVAIKYSIAGQFLLNTLIGFILYFFALIILISHSSELVIFLGKLNFSIILLFLSAPFIVQVIILAKNIRIFILTNINWKNLILMLLLISILLCISIQFFNVWPRWDSAAYFFGLEKLSPVNIFQNGTNGLIVCGHPGGAWALLIFLFVSIPKISTLNAIYLSNIALLILAFIIFYYILRELLSFSSLFIYSILAFVFTCSPYILGTISSINPEHLCLVGVLIFLLGILKNNYFICIISCYIICNSRETGIPIIATLIFIQLIYDLYYSKKGTRFCSFNWVYYIAAFVVGFTWLLIFLNSNWSEGMSNDFEFFYNDGTKMFGVRISFQYILNQIKGVFLTNFTWIYLLFIIFACLLFIKNSKMMLFKKLLKNKLYIMVLAGIVISIVEICLFLTHHNYRYYTLPVLFIQIFGILALAYITQNYKVNEYLKNLPIFLLGILLLIQCHITIDPIMLSVFPTLNTGAGKLAVMPWNIKDMPNGQFLECSNYNFQIPYFDKALDVAYSNMELEDGKVLIYDGYQWGQWGNTLNSIWGYGYEYMDKPAWGIWNSGGQYRELSYSPDNIINPVPINNTSEPERYLVEYKNVYYIELPWGDELINDLKDEYPNMKMLKKVEYHSWVLNVYSFN